MGQPIIEQLFHLGQRNATWLETEVNEGLLEPSPILLRHKGLRHGLAHVGPPVEREGGWETKATFVTRQPGVETVPKKTANPLVVTMDLVL